MPTSTSNEIRFGADSKIGAGIAFTIAGLLFGGYAGTLILFQAPGTFTFDSVSIGLACVALLALFSGLNFIINGKNNCIIVSDTTVTIQSTLIKHQMPLSDITNIRRTDETTILRAAVHGKRRKKRMIIDDCHFASIAEINQFHQLLKQRTGVKIEGTDP